MPLNSLMSEKKTVSVRRSASSCAIADQAGNDARVDELAERILDAFARPQLLDHAVERKGQAHRPHRASETTTGCEPPPDSIARALATSSRNPAITRFEPTTLIPSPMPQSEAMEQRKAQISVELLACEDFPGRSFGEFGDGETNSGQVRSERLCEFREVQRCRQRILPPAIGERRHRAVPDGQEFLEVAAKVFERAPSTRARPTRSAAL